MWPYTPEESDWLDFTAGYKESLAALGRAKVPRRRSGKWCVAASRNARRLAKKPGKPRMSTKVCGEFIAAMQKNTPSRWRSCLRVRGQYDTSKTVIAMWPYHDDESEWLDAAAEAPTPPPSDDDIDRGEEFVPC